MSFPSERLQSEAVAMELPNAPFLEQAVLTGLLSSPDHADANTCTHMYCNATCKPTFNSTESKERIYI